MQNDLFEKWYIENHPHSSLEKCEKGSYFRKKATLSLQSFQAGAQSKQAEIDELRSKMKAINEYQEIIFHELQLISPNFELIFNKLEDIDDLSKGTTNEQ